MSKLGFNIIKIVCLVTLIIAIIFSISYIYIFDKVEVKLKDDAYACVVEATKVIDTDNLETIIKNKLKDGSEQSEILNSLLLFKANQSVENLYILEKQDDETALFVVDASPDQAEFLEEYPMEAEMLNTFNGNITICDNITSDDYGTVLSAYAPIKNSSGQVIAIVCADSDVEVFQNIKSQLRIALIISIVSALVVSMLIALLFSKRLKKNMNVIKTNLRNMSNGDLTGCINIKSKDEINEIGQELSEFKEKISDTLSNIRKDINDTNAEAENLSMISNEMSISAKNVSSIIEEVAQSTNNQASDITNINQIFSDFGGDIDNIVCLMQDINTSAKDITLKSNESSNNISLIIDFIDKLSLQLNQVTGKIQGLGVSINKINEITNLINSIAEQTNLLALNASIEAARAGEAGKGFSVVADEIGKLAEQSKESSQNINQLLNNLSLESSQVVDNTENVNSQMMSQNSIISGVAGSLKDIMIGIEGILPKIHSASDSLSDINNKKSIIIKCLGNSSASIEEISASSEEIASSSETLSESTEQVATSAENLTYKMNNVTNSINKFKTM